jgi:Sec-independent protein translocase protein TatA
MEQKLKEMGESLGNGIDGYQCAMRKDQQNQMAWL